MGYQAQNNIFEQIVILLTLKNARPDYPLGVQDVQSYAVFIFQPQMPQATRFILGPMASYIGKLVSRCTRISSLPLATGSFENGVASMTTPPTRRLLTMA